MDDFRSGLIGVFILAVWLAAKILIYGCIVFVLFNVGKCVLG